MLQRFNIRRLACFTLLIGLLALVGAVQAAPARQDPYPAPQQPTVDPLAPLPTAARLTRLERYHSPARISSTARARLSQGMARRQLAPVEGVFSVIKAPCALR